MKLAIHHRPGSFSDRWIEYCEKKNIEYITVNAFDNDIIKQVKECDVLMWHHHHGDFKDVLTAKRILFSLEHAGIKVFPDFNTGWHFDDKVAQKYLLEAIDAPVVPSYVFYDKKSALNWLKSTSFPVVFKLKGGAGAANVKLIKDYKKGVRIVNIAFGKGFSQYNGWQSFKDRLEKYNRKKTSLFEVVKGFVRLFLPTNYSRNSNNERGYVYFQKFIPNNDSDTRVIIVNDKAFALKRMVRKNDFRASGSGDIIYSKNEIDIKCVSIAFEVSKRLKTQSVAFDFIFDNNNPLIVEISYGFSMLAYDKCEGFWDDKLNWHNKTFNPQEWMVNVFQK